MKRRLAKIEVSPAIADRLESEKIRAIKQRLKAESRGMSRDEFQRFLNGLTVHELVCFGLPDPRQLVDWSEASEKLLRAMESIVTGDMSNDDLPETLAVELENLPVIPEWVFTPNGPARWVRERLANYHPPTTGTQKGDFHQ